ncbi:conserved hypothetical protein [Wolbachia endosymbiont of Drosophila ananassae]|nr:conserved hypothetical protein [Wolbachia endosymbiont of Drosophila ananassae]
MSKEYDETKVKPAISTPQGPEGTNGSKAQSVLSNKRKPTINFDDKKYGVKTSKICEGTNMIFMKNKQKS